MARKLKIRSNILYHAYNRGFNKNKLFYNFYDYKRFCQTINRYKKRFKSIKIYSYCLLPNHFHFILSSTIDFKSKLKPEISEFMQKIQQSYAMYFNTKYGQTIKRGLKSPIFDGRFNVKEINNQKYLSNLQKYIKYNAVKHRIVEKVEDWLFC